MKTTFNRMILASCLMLLNLTAFGQCPGFRTQTQGGWGACANGNNPGAYLSANFAGAFPSGLTIGCTNKLVLTSASAVRSFLPSGSTPSALPSGTRTNPGSSYRNVLAGQLVAATINVRFDDVYASFGSSSLKLKNLIIASGPFSGWTVSQLLDEANKKIGGCSSTNSFSFSQYNTALTSLNENYVDGQTRGNFLSCPPAQLVIDAINDAGSSVFSNVGGTSFTNVLVNDKLNGAPATLANVTISFVSSTNGGVTLSGTNVVVAPGTPAGNYTLTYRICQTTNLSNCDQATVTVPVRAPLVINAVDDNGTSVVSAIGGISFTNVLVNDLLDGAPATLANVTISFISSTIGSVTLSGTNVLVAPGTPAGSYSLVYEICEIANPTNCDQATVTVPVSPDCFLSADVTLALACGCNGTATANATGGVAPFTYSWSNGTTGTDATITGLCPGEVISVTIVDSKGCTKSAEAGTIKNQTGCTGYSVEEQVQGLRNNGTPVEADRSITSKVLGVPDFSNTAGGFYSLGFGGYIVIKLDGAIEDHAGNDLRISETTFNSPSPQNCTNYPERARILVSQDNLSWLDVGTICQDGEVDIYPLTCIMYVKIIDISDPKGFGNQIVDGFDVDGIQCIYNTTSGARMAAPEAADKSNTVVASKRSQANLDLYPNPAENAISLIIEAAVEGEKLTVSVVDLLGREVRSINVNPETTRHMMEVSLEEMTSGVYMIRVNGEHYSQTKKFLKK